MKKIISMALALTCAIGFCAFASACEPEEKIVEVEKIVEKTYVVNITGGTAAYDEETKKVTATAATPAEGTRFVKWVDAEGADVSTEDPYTFDAANATLIAVYEDADLSMSLVNNATTAAGFTNWDGGDWMTPTATIQSEVTSGSLNAYKFSMKITDDTGASLCPDWSTSSWPDWDGKMVWVRHKINLESSVNVSAGKICFDIKYENIKDCVSLQFFSGETYISVEHYMGTDGKNINGVPETFGETVTALGDGWYHFEVDIAAYIGAEKAAAFADQLAEVDMIQFVFTTQNATLANNTESVVYLDNISVAESK